MQQLELREYTRAEIAEVLSVNLKDSNHFAERVKDKLDKWGYGYDYSRRAVTIISKPETSAARLKEIVIRSFGMDIQVDAVQFACFLAAFTDIEGFETMPWEERAIVYYKRYGVTILRYDCVSVCISLYTCSSILSSVALLSSALAYLTDITPISIILIS